MEYIKKECGSFNLHMIKTDKFKTITTSIMFTNELKKEMITKINFLTSALAYSTKKYPTKIEFSKKLEDLYAAKRNGQCIRIGNNFVYNLNIAVLHDDYSEKGLFLQALDFLKEILFNPNITNGEMDEATFNYSKEYVKARIEREKEDQRTRAFRKLFSLVDNDAKYSICQDGYLDDLEKIDRKNICEYHKELLEKSTIDIFVVGNIDFDQTYEIIKDKFKFKNKSNLIDYEIKEKKHNKEVKELVEKDSTSQAKLCIACTTEKLTDYEKKYVIQIYNYILGDSPDSKFFKNIREKHSLCYYVSSMANTLDNLFLIGSGINKDNYQEMMKLIKKEMNDMKKGKFSKEDIDKAKKYLISYLEEIEDYPAQLIGTYYAIDKLGSDDISKKIKIINKITKEDIVKLADKIHMDTVLLLGGDKK